MAPSPRARLAAIGTALPPHQGDQETVCRFVTRVLEETLDGREQAAAVEFARRIYATSGIETRQSVLPDFGVDDPGKFELFPPSWSLEPFPTTAARMALYERAVVPLAERAARRALDAARLDPERVTDLVITTCTGFFAPGPDVELVERLGLRPTTRRHLLGFMGCYAGFSGLRCAEALALRTPDAIVLQVSVELCTIHFQKSPEPDSLVAGCLFSDGASAAIWCAPEADLAPLAEVVGTHAFVASDTLDQMTWRIGDHGFEMRLSLDVPRSLRSAAPEFVAGLARDTSRGRGPMDRARTAWAIHPGGKRILDEVARALELERDDVAESRAVLREHGNMSSATILFVISRVLERCASGDQILALGFGPGLTIDGARLEVL